HAVAARALRRALRAVDGELPADALGWLWLASRVAQVLYDEERWAALSERMLQLTRAAGAQSVLPIAFGARIVQLVSAGDRDAGASAKADVEAARGGQPAYGALVLAAWQGREEETLAVHAMVIREATARGEAFALTHAGAALAVLYNGLGRY